MLYVIARKNKAGGVDVYLPQDHWGKPAKLWVSFDKHHPGKPDYRNRRVMLNCYNWPIMWDKSNRAEVTN